MSWLRLNALSVGSLTTTILLAVIVSYLLSLDRRTKETWYLCGYIGSLFLLLLGYTIRYSVFSAAALAVGQVPNLIVFGVASLIQFAYWFGGNPYRRESRAVLAITGAVALVVWGSLFAPGHFRALYDFQAEYFTYDYGPRISILALLEYIWALVVFVRKIGAGSAAGAPARQGFIETLLRPRGRSALSHRSFALLTLATLPIALQYTLFQTGVISRSTYTFVFNTGSLLICLLIFVVYVNNAPHPTSFLAKLVGIPLAVIMVTLGITSNAVMPVVQKTILDRYQSETNLAELAVESGGSSRLPTDVAWVLPEVPSRGGFRYVSRGAARTEPSGPTTGYPGTVHFRAGDLRDTSTFSLSYALIHAGTTYEVGFAYADYRRAVHEFALKLACAALLACILVVFGFPLVFRRGLLLPLRELLRAVRQVSAGNFHDMVPELSEDEIGQLARSYNRMVESLRNMEGNFKALAENAHDAILILSEEGRILFANGRASEVSGIAPHLLHGSHFGQIVPAEEVLSLQRRLAGRASGRDAPGSYETRIRRGDGRIVPVEVTAAATVWQGSPADVVIVRDIAERRHAEELLRNQQQQLMRMDKLASLGELVAGVAHEVSNPNHVVSMSAQFLSNGMPALFALSESSGELEDGVRIAGMPYTAFKGACEGALKEIETSTKRISHIVGELKRFVKGAAGKKERVDVNEVVRSVMRLSRHFIEKSTSRFTFAAAEPLPAVIADFVALEQVVLNLIENACLSLPEQGRGIRVSTRYEQDAGAVIVQVRDEGVGMREQVLRQVTEPFFTTRADSGGTGLGLSIANRIIRGVGGTLRFESTVGVGTCVTVQLPAAVETPVRT